MAIKHYYYFGEYHSNSWNGGKLDREKWEELRNNGEDSNFALSESQSEYEKNCQDAIVYKEAAKILNDEIESRRWQDRRIISLGAGTGVLEWHLKQLNPKLHVECTDYTITTMDRLKKVFPGLDDAYEFDMLEGDYSAFDSDSILVFHRLSAEFDKEQWKNVFSKLKNAGLNDIIYTPCEVLNPIIALKEILIHIRNRIKGHRDTFCGWMYSEKELLDIFDKGGYAVDTSLKLGITKAYFLRRQI